MKDGTCTAPQADLMHEDDAHESNEGDPLMSPYFFIMVLGAVILLMLVA